MEINTVLMTLGLCVLGAPLVFLAFLGLSSLLEHPPSEQNIGRIAAGTILIGFLAALGTLGVMIWQQEYHYTLMLGHWVVLDGEHFGHHFNYHFSVKFIFDMLSVPFVILSFILCGTVGAFANKYLHREPGFNRFFVLYALFVLGMVTTALAGTIETLFFGWELVGLSSALLVAFFQERARSVVNGFRVWIVYRISDAALLIAAVVLHHLTSGGDFDALLGTTPWPFGQASITAQQAFIVGTLLFIAAMGKSALVPFSGWLPRAMEGPTPSSAVFYGALSVHLGAFLLLRVSPILELSPALCAMVVAIGLLTAVFAALAGRVQTDIKSALAFASLTQVGIIVAEVGLGLRYIALIHLIGHACLRTLQFLRASTLLQDYRALENALGSRLPRSSGFWARLIPESTRIWFYRLALERGYFDALLANYIAYPFLSFFRWCDAMERKWTDFLSGGQSRESDQVRPYTGTIEDTL